MLIGGAAIDAGEAVDEGQLRHVHGDDVEACFFGGGDVLIDPAGVGGHDDDVESGVVLVGGLAGDRVTQKGVGGVEGKFESRLLLDGVLDLFFFGVFHGEVLDVDDGRGEPEHGAAAVEFTVDEKIANGFGEETEPGVGIIADVGGDLGAGGGEKLEIVAFGLDLGEAKRAGAKIDTDWMRGGAKMFWMNPSIADFEGVSSVGCYRRLGLRRRRNGGIRRRWNRRRAVHVPISESTFPRPPAGPGGRGGR